MITGKRRKGYLMNLFKCMNFCFPGRLSVELLMLLSRCFTANEIIR